MDTLVPQKRDLFALRNRTRRRQKMATPTTTVTIIPTMAPKEMCSDPELADTIVVIVVGDAVLVVDIGGSVVVSEGVRVGREGITLWITLAKGAPWIMAEHSTTESRNCRKFRTSVPAKETNHTSKAPRKQTDRLRKTEIDYRQYIGIRALPKCIPCELIGSVALREGSFRGLV